MYIEVKSMLSIPVVTAMNATSFRKELRKQLETITQNDVTMIITRPDEKNVVVLSEEQYQEMIKTINNLSYELKLTKSFLEIEQGNYVEFDSVEELKKKVGLD
jgi:antitoxin YefM